MEPSFTRGRKWRIGFNVTVAIVSAFALVVMANYLAARHAIRYNWSNAAANQLSPLTTRVLKSLTNTVKVTVFFVPGETMFSSVAGLIKDYQAVTPKLEVDFVDYTNPGRGNMVRAKYQMVTGEGSRVIFDCNGRVRSVAATELSDYGMTTNREFRRTAFKGEQLFTSAILSVTSSQHPKAYFLGGHGEHKPDNEDQQDGYSRFTKMLTGANVDLAGFDSLQHRDVPQDCALLIIAGPLTRFTREELDRLDNYLSQGGRIFAALRIVQGRPPTGLEGLLEKWNIQVGETLARDKREAKASEDGIIVASRFAPQHPITRPLLNSQIELIYPRAVGSRSIGAVRADAPKVTELMFTSEKGQLIEFNEKGEGELAKPAAAIPLAVAVEKGGIQGVAADRGSTRLVVVGSSISFVNGVFNEVANADFANLAVNWLLSREMRAEIPPRAMSEYRITVTERQMKTLRWIFLAVAPLGVLALGGIVWLKRRF
jgi:hypothetical protein